MQLDLKPIPASLRFKFKYRDSDLPPASVGGPGGIRKCTISGVVDKSFMVHVSKIAAVFAVLHFQIWVEIENRYNGPPDVSITECPSCWNREFVSPFPGTRDFTTSRLGAVLTSFESSRHVTLNHARVMNTVDLIDATTKFSRRSRFRPDEVEACLLHEVGEDSNGCPISMNLRLRGAGMS
jgi:hypothetical protein